MNFSKKYICLVFSLYVSVLCASDSLSWSAWNAALKNLFSRHYQAASEHAVSAQTLSTQTGDQSTQYALWTTAALATIGASALVFKHMKHKKCVQRGEQYNPELTNQLSTLFNTIKGPIDFQQHRKQIFDLVKNGANPNIKNSLNTSSLLERLVTLDDLEFMQLCLQKGATPDITTLDLRTPLTWTKSAQITQCLLDNKADPYQRDRDGNSLLHHIIIRCSAYGSESVEDVLTLFCNTGLDPNQLNNEGISPLHQLCFLPHQPKSPLWTMMPLLWRGANLDLSSVGVKTPRQILQEKYPELSVQAQALSVAIPKKQEALYNTIRTQHNDLLQAHLSPDSAGIVIEYVGRDKLPWHKTYWSELKESSAT